ncbi:hypothetical protein AMTRI_Chr05g60630 [Amborella trichopoda]
MGQKKPSVLDEECALPSVQGVSMATKKNKKKGRLIDDDEYSIGAVSVEDQIDQQQGLGNGKHSSDAKVAEEMDTMSQESMDSKKNSKPSKRDKKGKRDLKVDDDEYNIEGIVNEAPPQETLKQLEGGKKKGKKSNKQYEADDFAERDDDTTATDVVFEQPKNSKKKSGKKLGLTDAFSLLASMDDEQESTVTDNLDLDESEEIQFTGKKKKKGSKGRTLDLGLDISVEPSDDVGLSKKTENDVEEEVVQFTGKKKSKKGIKACLSFLEDDPYSPSTELDQEKPAEEDKDDAADMPVFSGKKKSKSKKSNSSFAAALTEEDQEPATSEALEPITEANKQENEDTPDGDGVTPLDTSLGSKKPQKKKKNKSGRTAQEEDDLDKILAELGAGPPAPAPAPAPPPPPTKSTAPAEESVQTKDVASVETSIIIEEPKLAEGDGDAEGVESAAAKKKKKKKEKEKEKKAAAVEEKAKEEEAKSKAAADKKVPKHVREMQERLARLKEVEEKKKKEEEERLRKEEEERLRLEELERQKEEAKRRKKEKEKEKLRKKKQEGKLLTGKQKEEARRLALMREQFLSQSGMPTDTSAGVTKRPKYESKKKKPGPSTQVPVETGETTVVDDQPDVQEIEKVELDSVAEDNGEKMEVEHVVEENNMEEEGQEVEVDEEEENDEWDAKSWDDTDLVLPVKSAFAEEEEDDAPLVNSLFDHKMNVMDNKNLGLRNIFVIYIFLGFFLKKGYCIKVK